MSVHVHFEKYGYHFMQDILAQKLGEKNNIHSLYCTKTKKKIDIRLGQLRRIQPSPLTHSLS